MQKNTEKIVIDNRLAYNLRYFEKSTGFMVTVTVHKLP